MNPDYRWYSYAAAAALNDPYVSAAAAYAFQITYQRHLDQHLQSKRIKLNKGYDDDNLFPKDESNGLSKPGSPITFRPHSDVIKDTTRKRKYCQINGESTLASNSKSLEFDTYSNRNSNLINSKQNKSVRPKCYRKLCKSDSDSDSDSQGPVSILLPEILTMIFRYLDIQSRGRAAQVCSKWLGCVYEKSVWKGTVARIHLKTRAYPTLFPSFVKRGIKNVQVLSLRKSLREVINGIPNLQSLNLSGCYNLTDSALDGAFNKDLPHLKSLDLSLCKDVNDNSLGRIATHCKNLENLNLAGCTKVTNTGLLLISWGLRSIKKLNLRSCRYISDQGIGHLAGIGSVPKKGVQKLEELILQDCQKITDKSLEVLSDELSSLKKMNLSFCISITDTGMKSLCRMDSLIDLNLRSCDNISDLGIGYLGESSNPKGSNLSSLDTSFCSNITDTSTKHIAHGIYNLKNLSMSNCLITDIGLTTLASKLIHLETLNIGQCLDISKTGLSQLTSKLKNLSSVDIYGCSKMTKEEIAGLQTSSKLTINLNLWPTISYNNKTSNSSSSTSLSSSTSSTNTT